MVVLIAMVAKVQLIARNAQTVSIAIDVITVMIVLAV